MSAAVQAMEWAELAAQGRRLLEGQRARALKVIASIDAGTYVCRKALPDGPAEDRTIWLRQWTVSELLRVEDRLRRFAGDHGVTS